MQRPNILIFMTDQQRGDSIPPYSKAKTPNLDKFCMDGVTFSQAYCVAPHCCPSRASFFTGLYPTEHGVWNNVDVGNALSRGLFEGVRLWSEDFKDAGYDMYFSGKWHISHYETPEDRGWKTKSANSDKHFSSEPVMGYHRHKMDWKRYKGDLALRPEKTDRGEGEILRPGYSTYTHYGERLKEAPDISVIADALERIKSREQSHKPWCQYIGPIGPHDPYFVPKKYLDMYDINDIELPDNFNDLMYDKPGLYRKTRARFDQLTPKEHKEAIRHYLAYCSFEDDLFGQVLNALEEAGEIYNTLVLYISDHGDYMGDHGLWCKGLPCFKPAYHIPAAVRWPEGIVNPGRVIDEFVSIADFAPTFLNAADIMIDRKFTGKSLLPFIKDDKPVEWRDAIYTQTNGNELYGIQRSVMTKEWKYVYNGFDFDELYDLINDPGETENLINDLDKKEIVRQMCKRMWKFAQETGDLSVNQYIMVALAPFGPAEAFRPD